MVKNKKTDLDFSIISEVSGLLEVSLVELIATCSDLKPAMSELINFDDFDGVNKKLDQADKLLRKTGLKLATSKYKYIVNSPRGIFEIVDLKDPRKGKLGIGIANNKKDAVEAVDLYYKKTKDSKASDRFAVLHGYPDCCTKFGVYLCNEDGDPDNFGFKNPAVESLKKSKNFAWQLNVFTQSILSHYPCSLECKKSINYVDKLFNVIDKLDQGYGDWWRSLLQEPASLYWTCVDKILLYGDFRGDFENSEINYHKVESKISSKDFYQDNDDNFLGNLEEIFKKIKRGDRLIMAPGYFEIYKKGKRIGKIKKDNKYSPVLVKPNK